MDFILTIEIVGQALELVEACFVSIGHILRLSIRNMVFWLTGDLDLCHGSTVGHAHITADASCRLTLGTHDLSRGDMHALTLQDALHAVVVGLLRQNGLILVGLLNQVGGNGVCPGIGIVAMFTAQQTIKIAFATTDDPLQFDAALLLLGGNAGYLVHVHELVAGQIAFILLHNTLCQGVGIGACYLQWRRATLDHQIEVVFHALTRQVIRKLMLLNGIFVTRQVHLVGFRAVSTLRLHLQYQLGALVPEGDVIGIVHGCIHHRKYAVSDLTPGVVTQCSMQLCSSHCRG